MMVAEKKRKTRKNVPVFEGKIPFITSLLLNSVDKKIVKNIYLFGSYARGTANANSDIDICVVIDDKAEYDDTNIKMQGAFCDNGIYPADLLVYHQKEFREAQKNRGIQYVAKNYGVLLYGK